MLSHIGLKTLDELTQKAVPAQIRTQNPLQVGPERGETELLKDLKATAQKNKLLKNFIGMGYSGTITPNGKFFYDRFARDLTNCLWHVPIILFNYTYEITARCRDNIFFWPTRHCAIGNTRDLKIPLLTIQFAFISDPA